MRYIDPRHKVLHHSDRIAAIKEGALPPPINVEIDLSNRCSLGCKWCHFAYTHTRGPLAGKVVLPAHHAPGGDLMNADLAKNIIEQLAEYGIRSITWTGGGEPTLHPQFDDIVSYCHDIGMDQGLYTHGGHLHDSRARQLKRVMKWVYVSLDECTRDSYLKSKGVDRFDAVMDGVRRLVDADGDATIGIGFLLHSGNLDQVQQMVDLYAASGADYMQFRPTIDYQQDAPNNPPALMDWVDDAIDVMRQYEAAPNILVDIERFKMYRNWERGYQTCYWSAVQTVITPDGSVWRCVNKREHGGAKLGNLAEAPFNEIWQAAGGACTVDSSCRVMCRGHIGNITLDAVMENPKHRNFI